MTDLLFVHGGGDGAYGYDKKIVDRLRPLLAPDMRIEFPHVRGLETLEWEAVAGQLGAALNKLSDEAVVVAHSVGAAAMLKLLSGGADPPLSHLFLLAVPYNGADGEWGDSDFSFPSDFAKHLPKRLPITLWHAVDDEVIPVSNAHRYEKKLPAAKVNILPAGGHQFSGDLSFLAAAIREAAP